MYFDASKLPSPKNEYVLWVDIMGTKNIMSDSVNTAANFIFKFHGAIQSSKDAHAKYYPLMDGVFITTPSQIVLKRVIRKIFVCLFEIYSKTELCKYRFLAKGSISFGPVIHGRDVPKSASTSLENDLNYKTSILMGTPMIQAYSIEKLAPPFGVFIHESARTFAPKQSIPFSGKYFQWFPDNFDKAQFEVEVKKYFDWAIKYEKSLELDAEKSKYYMKIFGEYVGNYT
ncbi:hypothetical protein [Roseivirga sp.]|uniref:hypothetical protein n=1 Tax=Roseivirga sp. TaxID=1964215 RepID=UPI003B515F26